MPTNTVQQRSKTGSVDMPLSLVGAIVSVAKTSFAWGGQTYQLDDDYQHEVELGERRLIDIYLGINPATSVGVLAVTDKIHGDPEEDIVFPTDFKLLLLLAHGEVPAAAVDASAGSWIVHKVDKQSDTESEASP